jgi:hypothetical protein
VGNFTRRASERSNFPQGTAAQRHEDFMRQEARVIGKQICAGFSQRANWAVIELVQESSVRQTKSPG